MSIFSDRDNKSTVEAQKVLFIDRRNIARKCNRRYVSDGLMYMWADEYEKMNAWYCPTQSTKDTDITGVTTARC